jgi:hypothetical protein
MGLAAGSRLLSADRRPRVQVNYYHWVAEGMSRLLLSLRLMEQDKQRKLLVPQGIAHGQLRLGAPVVATHAACCRFASLLCSGRHAAHSQRTAGSRDSLQGMALIPAAPSTHVYSATSASCSAIWSTSVSAAALPVALLSAAAAAHTRSDWEQRNRTKWQNNAWDVYSPPAFTMRQSR